MTRFRIGHFLKTRLWAIPLLFVLGGVGLSLIATAVDDGEMIPRNVSGDPAAALQILYLIAFSMLTLTGLVLSLVVVVVQLGMGVFSPRIVRQILQDRPSQAAIGLFAGTFAFAILAIPRVGTDSGTVPGLAVVVAIVLVLACIVTLVWYVNHIGQSLRVAALVGWVAEDTLTTLEHVFPDHGDGGDGLEPGLIATPRSGVIFAVGHDRLVSLAEQAGCRLVLLWSVGDFVPTGAALFRVVGDPASPLPPGKVTKCVVLGPERTLNQDVAYGIRLLVDIAEGALTSGPFADPTTAVQAIDRLHDILRAMVRRPLDDGRYHDAQGELRLVVPTLHWEGFVGLAFDELRQVGAASPQVTRRLQAALEDLLSVAPLRRRAALERQMRLLEFSVAKVSRHDEDRDAALIPDPSGIGSGPDRVGPIKL